ncbi:kin-16 [Acrasis kona]|uniref:Kin-16 n=1 Tax=Acrasis kona TaxID=1008807 RepID=A0AAW2ZL64_9EUKA
MMAIYISIIVIVLVLLCIFVTIVLAVIFIRRRRARIKEDNNANSLDCYDDAPEFSNITPQTPLFINNENNSLPYIPHHPQFELFNINIDNKNNNDEAEKYELGHVEPFHKDHVASPVLIGDRKSNFTKRLEVIAITNSNKITSTQDIEKEEKAKTIKRLHGVFKNNLVHNEGILTSFVDVIEGMQHNRSTVAPSSILSPESPQQAGRDFNEMAFMSRKLRRNNKSSQAADTSDNSYRKKKFCIFETNLVVIGHL